MAESLCLVVPCYNEARRLLGQEFQSWLGRTDSCEILFVDDGSHDATPQVLRDLAAHQPRIRVLSLPSNMGKAEAVRQGFLAVLAQSRFTLLGYLDADLSTPLSEMARLRQQCAQRPEVEAWYGSRVLLLGTQIDRTPLRHYAGRIVATLISMVLELPVYDSQCGAKIFRHELAGQIFAQPFLSRWLFDVELLARIRNLYGKSKALERVAEFSLQSWRARSGSKLRLRDVLRVPLELAAIRRRYGGAI